MNPIKFIIDLVGSTLKFYVTKFWFTMPITIYIAIEAKRYGQGKDLFIVMAWKKCKQVIISTAEYMAARGLK